MKASRINWQDNDNLFLLLSLTRCLQKHRAVAVSKTRYIPINFFSRSITSFGCAKTSLARL